MPLRIGQVFRLPAEEDPAGDTKPGRPHALVALADSQLDVVTLAFCSSQETEARKGAPSHKARLSSSSSSSGDAQRPELTTIVYPSRLVSYVASELPRPWRSVVSDMPVIRAKLRDALGIGTGTSDGKGAAQRTLRGHILKLGSRLRDEQELDTDFALIVAGPPYVRKVRYLNIIPLYDAARLSTTPASFLTSREEWVRRLGWREVAIATDYICSCYFKNPQHAERLPGVVIDAHTMKAIDGVMTSRFQLSTVTVQPQASSVQRETGGA